jgi:hypothetical protein
VSGPDPSDLYGLPLERFVPERGVLAKALKRASETDEAARVAALRKPSVAAWTVNQLVRTQRAAVAALFEAGDALQRAQSDLLGGGGEARALREASRSERVAVDELVAVARGLLSSEGQEPTQATLDRVSETLHAAALDEDARARVRDGCLEREIRQVGFGAGGFAGASAPAAGGSGRRRAARKGGAAAKSAAAKSAAAEREQAKRERAAAEQAERDRAEQLKSARRAVAEARRQSELTTRQLATAQERRDRAAGALHDAEEALATARERAEEGELAHQRAQQLLEGL